jgi:surface antigen
MIDFKQRTTEPSSDDPYFSSENPFSQAGFPMPNCTTYAYGRVWEETGSKPNLCLHNANQWFSYNQQNGAYPYGDLPAIGAVVVFSGTDENSAGHVAVVEYVYSDGSWKQSQSHYGGVYWDLENYSFSNKKYGDILGFIYVGNWKEDDFMDDTTNYIFEDYIEFLDRLPDTDGLESFKNLIDDQGGSYDSIDRMIQASQEYRKNIVSKFYKIILGREGSESEISDWEASGKLLRDIFRDFWESEEAKNKRGEEV